MQTHIILVWQLLLCVTLTICKLGPPGGPLKMTHDVVDPLKVFQNFQYVVAVVDSDNDAIYECMSANRTAFDPEQKTVTFTWNLQEAGSPPREPEALYQRVGDDPETLIFWTDADPTPKEGKFYYTDYYSCVVLDMEYSGHQCVLWVPIDLVGPISRQCIDHYEDACGIPVPAHPRQFCGDINLK